MGFEADTPHCAFCGVSAKGRSGQLITSPLRGRGTGRLPPPYEQCLPKGAICRTCVAEAQARIVTPEGAKQLRAEPYCHFCGDDRTESGIYISVMLNLCRDCLELAEETFSEA